MTAPAGVKVTVPDVGPETWVVSVGDRWATIRFWPASGERAKLEHGPYVTVLGPSYERETSPEDLERYAHALYAAARKQRARVTQAALDAHPTLFDEPDVAA